MKLRLFLFFWFATTVYVQDGVGSHGISWKVQCESTYEARQLINKLIVADYGKGTHWGFYELKIIGNPCPSSPINGWKRR